MRNRTSAMHCALMSLSSRGRVLCMRPTETVKRYDFSFCQKFEFSFLANLPCLHGQAALASFATLIPWQRARQYFQNILRPVNVEQGLAVQYGP